jgi:hypothetical protein
MKTFLISATLFLLLSAGYAHAQTQPAATQTATQFCTGGSCTYVPLEPLPFLPNCFGPNCAAGKTNGSFASLIGGSFKLLIGAGGVIAVVMIVLGALTYMFSDIVGNKKKALDRIRGAMWAVVLLVSSYLILYTINPELLTFNLNLNAPATGAPQAAPVQVPINNAGSTKIYDGSNAYDQMMTLSAQCESQSQGQKALHQAPGGTDATGSYSLFSCY